MSTCTMTGLVDRHFARRIRPPQERVLREHLPGCARCGDRYRRHLVLAGLDPRAPAAEARLAVGLGLRGPSRPWIAPAAVAVAVALGVALALGRHDASADRPAFARRGSAATRLVVYRIAPGGKPETAGRAIGRRDELAFAYENGADRRYLMVYGRDEHGHVYWFHPAWSDPAASPGAVPIERHGGLVELPEAVAHSHDGSRLVIHGRFLDHPVSVREVERAPAMLVAGDHVVVELEVTP